MIFDFRLYTALSKTNKENHRLIYAALMDPNPDNYTLPDHIKSFDMISMLSLHIEGTAPGIHIITDMKDVSFTHITKLGLLHLKKFFFYLQVYIHSFARIQICFKYNFKFQEAMPVRVKGLHFINSPSFIDKLLSLIKPFMKKELLEVVYKNFVVSFMQFWQ